MRIGVEDALNPFAVADRTGGEPADLWEYAVRLYPHAAAFPSYLSTLHLRLPAMTPRCA